MISPVKIWRRQKEIRKLLGKTGVIITWTRIFASGVEFKKFAPYPVILVKLNDGAKAVGQLVDYDESKIRVGAKVIAVLRKTRDGSREDVIAYGVKFKLL